MADVIIDTCVLRGAGETDNVNSIACRSILDAVYDADCLVIADDILRAEWDDHASCYSLRWRAALESQARLITVSLAEANWVPFDQALTYLDASNAVCARKDAHLVLTALRFRAFVVSSERASRRVLGRLALYFDALFEVAWAPTDQVVRIKAVCRRTVQIPRDWYLYWGNGDGLRL